MKCASETWATDGDRLDVERLGVGAVHRVAGAEQAPVQVLDIPAHGATLRDVAGGRARDATCRDATRLR